MAFQGLFVGLVTLDLVYLTTGLPEQNQKIVASDYTVAAGGPATNAAVTFSYLGNRASLLGIVGIHPINCLIRTDLDSHSVTLIDLSPSQSEPPPVSSIITTQATGDRAAISINATKTQVSGECLPLNILQEIDIVLIDGHQMAVGEKIARLAKENQIPVVIDGGSWKPGFERILPFVDYAICSENFHPPSCDRAQQEVLSYLSALGIPHIAITGGEKPIQYLSQGTSGSIEVPQINPVDTMGAGDIFHGAFCNYILRKSFADAIASAAKIASHSCQFFGTRRWMQKTAPK
ncbi:sugar kinase [Trichocoleus sp. ST-U3]|uniref:sugar kinase n=1 Tax=Coleofasciculus sp. FACHB-542 TaxID=2692787 RepID=UPI00168907AF|nr:sugar kinase [Coleofasciculus sp. FACHB-542]MBD2088147.1 sugar kinase [Coleofasciculus sp. FACHB-542]